MPIYEYECKKCGNIEEVLQKFSDKPLKTCNACSGRLDKLISHSSFHLKGTGWYVTDYANKSADPSAPKPSESSAPKDSKEKTTSSKKPSEKSSSK